MQALDEPRPARESFEVAASSSSPKQRTSSDLLNSLTQFNAPTLAHLIALVCHPIPSFPPPDTSLLVIDSFSTLFANAYPRDTEIATPKKARPGACELSFALLKCFLWY